VRMDVRTVLKSSLIESNEAGTIDCMCDAEYRAVPATTRRKRLVPATAVKPGMACKREG